MQIELNGLDAGIFAIARAISLRIPNPHFIFHKNTADQGLAEEVFWDWGLQYILKEVTRFGRVGIAHDQSHKAVPLVLQPDLQKSLYEPKDPKRAEKEPLIGFFPTQILHHMALEGWGNSVEFRRIGRKYIRQAKSHNIDTLFFPESIFAENTTQKTLQHLAGNQMKIITLGDVIADLEADKIKGLETSRPPESANKGSWAFDATFSDFELQRASEILRTKWPKDLTRI